MGAGPTKQATGSCLKHCTLWKADRSPSCRAVMMALDAMNLSINEIDLNMDKGEHKTPEMHTMNSLQTLPVLKDRELVLTDSHAIMCYLIGRYCNDGRLLPRDPGGRSLTEQLLHYNSGVIYPKYRAAAYPILYDECRHVMPHHVCEIEATYAELEALLQGRLWFGNGAWPMLSDICFCSTISSLNIMVPIDKFRFPRLSSWLQRISQEMFYLTANSKGLSEFSRKIDSSQDCVADEKEFKCPRTSEGRRSVTQLKAEQAAAPPPSAAAAAAAAQSN